MFLLDTNVVSELRKVHAGRADPQVSQWVSTVPSKRMFISAISLMEIELGVLLISRRDAAQGTNLQTWLTSHVLPFFSGRVLAVDEAVARRCAPLHVPNPRPERDALIAATALVHAMTMVTRNVVDFSPMGVVLLNPWTSVAAGRP